MTAGAITIAAHDLAYEIGDCGDGVIGRALRQGEPYERRVLEHIYRLGLRGVALDIGAHVGNHALWFAVVCGLQVVAVEPLTPEELQANVDRNELREQIEVWPFALGDREYFAGNGGKGRVRGEGQIPVRRLDDCVEDLPPTPVALVKVDVEGMEPEVLRGGIGLIERHRPLIFAEAWDHDAHARVREVLAPLGYRHTKTFGATPLEEWACR